MITRVDINKDLITWAIERAGYELQEYIAQSPKIAAWLNDEKKPTVRQLENFSKHVHLPFGYLFLDKPPVETLPIPFFRTGKTPAKKVSINVYDTILALEKRQNWLVEYLEENDFEPLDFVGKYDLDSDYQVIANDIRKTLGIDDGWASGLQTYHDALNFLNGKAESKRIITIFNSVVGSNNSRKIEVEECRGFVLVDKLAPFMFVNAGDAKSAQIFTFVHELAHIWLGESAGFDIASLEPANDPMEQLCDRVAAEFLVPAHSLIKKWEETPDFIKVSKHFKVSPIVIGRRAMDLGKVSRGTFFGFYKSYIKSIQNLKKKKSTGGNFYATAKYKANLSFVAFVDKAVKQNQLLYRDAYSLTGLKGDTYHKFIQQHLY